MIAIIGAMEEEVLQLIEKLEDKKQNCFAHVNFYEGKIGKKELVVVQCGIGKVNAACCTQIVIDKYNPELIINTGIAGGVNENIEVGDIVIATDAVEYDVDVTPFGYKIGEIPGMNMKEFPIEEEVVNQIFDLCKYNSFSVHKGRVVSGDKFVSDSSFKKYLKDEFNAYCTEMEGAAIAHVAYLNNKKCVIIRAISDKADNSANIDYKVFEKEAIDKFILLIIKYCMI